MKRGNQYSDKVIAFALAARARGNPWKKIVTDIATEFNTRPPSERQMRKWYKEWGASPSDQETFLKQTMLNTARAAIPAAAYATEKFAIEQGIPELMKALNDSEDPQIAIGMMILSMLEKQLGREIFDNAVSKYQRTRENSSETQITRTSNQNTSNPIIKK